MSRVPPSTSCLYADDQDTYSLLVCEGIATMDEEEAMIHSCYCDFKDENIIYFELFYQDCNTYALYMTNIA